eukprot:Gb_00870 [translate_table: standard]
MQEGNSKSSFWHTTLNIIGGMMGQALMSLPYALVNGGWAGLSVPIVFGIMFGFAANSLTRCLQFRPCASNYQDIGEAAFSKRGRIITTILLYAEIFLILVAYTISLKDSLDVIFPQAKFGNHVSGGGSEFLYLNTCIHWLCVLRCCHVRKGGELSDNIKNVFLGSVGSRTRVVVRGAISSVILIVVLVMAISLPYFGYVMALVGSLFSVVVSFILPCIFYIKICRPKTTVVVLNLSFIAIGMLFGITGTIFSVKALIRSVKEAHGPH